VALTFTVKPHKDEPVDNATLLGAGKMVSTLADFLASKDLISPLVIAVNGEWGSGKTSLITTVKKELEKKGTVTAIFNAWQYEYSEPAGAMVYQIVSQTGPNKEIRRKAKEMAGLALDIFARKTAGIDLPAIKQHFEGSVSAVTTLSNRLEKYLQEDVQAERMVVFIDDLDRCSLENVIQLLEAVKLFLTVPKAVFVLAVDISKVKLAWSLKYGRVEQSIDEGPVHGKADRLTEEGLKYLEKIIQIQLELPKPSNEQLKEYLKSLDPGYTDDFCNLIAALNLTNPRSIKRFLNLVSFRANIPETGGMKTEAALVWTAMEHAAGEEAAAKMYNAYGDPSMFLQAINELGGFSESSWENQLKSSSKLSLFSNVSLGKLSLRDFWHFSKAVRPFSGKGGDIYTALGQIVAFSRRA